MGFLRTLARLVSLGLTLVGVAAIGFVVLAYGWNGEPPTVSLE